MFFWRNGLVSARYRFGRGRDDAPRVFLVACLREEALGRHDAPGARRIIGLPQPIAARDGRVFEQSAIAGRRGARLFSRNFHEFWVSLRILGLLLSEKQIPQIVENLESGA